MDEHFPGPPEHIMALFDGVKNEAGETIRGARDTYSKIYRLLNFDGFKFEYSRLAKAGEITSEVEQRATNLEYALLMIETYVTSEPDEREKRMMTFADENQKRYEDVKAVLDYLGLPV